MGKKTKVAFAVACNTNQTNEWWSNFAIELGHAMADPAIDVVGVVIKPTAQVDHNKNDGAWHALSLLDDRRAKLTDVNRNAVVSEVEETDAEFIYWWDDDTRHPRGTLSKLLSLGVPFATGLYYLKLPPCNPVAYFRKEDGSYTPLVDFRRGELIEVDSTGMGCALISREVYEGIRATHNVYRRDNYSLTVKQRSDTDYVKPHVRNEIQRLAGKVVGDFAVEHLTKLTDEEIDSHVLRYPYYCMEYGRTEDHWFCELAAHAGFRPLVDTNINCEHYGQRAITRSNFLEFEIAARKERATGSDK